MKKLLVIFATLFSVIAICFAGTSRQDAPVMSMQQKEDCFDLFRSYIEIAPVIIDEHEQIYLDLMASCGETDPDSLAFFRNNIRHVDSLMVRCIAMLLEEDPSRELMDILDPEYVNILSHPASNSYNVYKLNSLLEFLYYRYIESEQELYAKELDMWELYRIRTEALQASWGSIHPHYPDVLRKLLYIYIETGNSKKVAEMSELLKSVKTEKD